VTAQPADLAYFEKILEHLRQSRGFDFTAYKRASLMRRIVRRMQEVGVASFEQYLDYLQVRQDEFSALFNTILINVTSFFRDKDVWDAVGSRVLNDLLDGRSPTNPLRIWSAGCASGEEPYSVALLLADRLGLDALPELVKIYATDVDEEALTQARRASYPERQLEAVPDALRKYFDRDGTSCTVNREIRRAVIFGRLDLLQDAPISRVDLLLCRNTLMYLNADAQRRILARFWYSTTPEGYLVLGRSEMLFTHGAMFVPIDLKRRMFRATPKPNQRDRLLVLAQTGHDVMPENGGNHHRLREAAFQSDAAPEILLDGSGTVVALNGAARLLFRLTGADLGRPLKDLELSYRPIELREPLERARLEGREVVIKDVSWRSGPDLRTFDVRIAPLFDEDAEQLGARIRFVDVSQLKHVEEELQHSRQELETAYEELQSTNEELETTNEELQSTVEELETTNEELQSTNEELETMNEELQSTNEELQTINDELRNRSTELNSTNTFLAAIFTSLRNAVVVIDRECRVQVWSARAEDMWGLRPEEAQNSSFLNLDIGLPVAELRKPIRAVLSGANGHGEVELDATSRRGKPMRCRVTISPLRQSDDSVGGAILLMEETKSSNP
jgi:two-component system CheB/CheR fusion protein